MKRYVLGFLFNDQSDRVTLIEKRRPDWQEGKLNGVGGKIDVGEDERAAMAREFLEETGVETDPYDWTFFGKIHSADWGGLKSVVYLYKMRSTAKQLLVGTKTDERVVTVFLPPPGAYYTLPNVPALIAAAIDPMQPMITLEYARAGF
jgi:8-oxo-dGTP pyrophosphatase MutT (NUDIX family)